MVKTLAGLDDGSITPKQQDHSRATLAPILTRDDGRMVFAKYTARELWNRWRGFQPWPGVYTSLEGKKLIVHRMQVAQKDGPGEPGLVEVADGSMLVACAQGTWIDVAELQLEGKKRMTAADFLRGAALESGVRLG
jgi:methionyl-tRNA formyltransferase